MRTILIAALLTASAAFLAAPASAQIAGQGLSPNVNVNGNILDTSRVPKLGCLKPGSRACAQDNRQPPGQAGGSTHPSGGQGGGPRPARRP